MVTIFNFRKKALRLLNDFKISFLEADWLTGDHPEELIIKYNKKAFRKLLRLRKYVEKMLLETSNEYAIEEVRKIKNILDELAFRHRDGCGGHNFMNSPEEEGVFTAIENAILIGSSYLREDYPLDLIDNNNI